MLDILKAILMGIIEGITEWLPISSTGHLILVEEFVNMGTSDAFNEMFNVVIQFGAILAVVVIYFHKLNPFSPRKNTRQKRNTFQLWFKVIIASIPAAAIGLPLDDWMDKHLHNYIVVSIMLIVYGILFILVEKRNEDVTPRVTKLTELTYTTALIIGVFQALAMVPGTSRSGATILGALLIGTSRYVATEFTFFLAIPAMAGASLWKLLKFVLGGTGFTGIEVAVLLTGCITAFAVSIVAIKFLIGYIKKNDFKVFGYYRIALGVIVLGFFAIFR